MNELKDILMLSLKEAGRTLRKYYGNLSKIEYKSDVNLVTQADKESEATIIKIIKSAFPKHQILAEESGITKEESEYKWIVDPLDGTTNYAHTLPIFAISIGIEYKKEIIMGGVYNPISNELFFSEKGNGAYLNDKKICVSKVDKLEKALLVTGFPYDRRENVDYYMDVYGKFLKVSQGVMRLGAAAIDFCSVACGRLDGYWERKLYPWDQSAGMLIVEEAGGKVTDFSGNKTSCYNKQVLVTNGLIHNGMVKILKKIKHS